MTFGLHAGCVHVDDTCRRLVFGQLNEGACEHESVMARSEVSPDEAVADLANVYLERDDQGWGGYGGINQVVLTRDRLTLHPGKRVSTRMGGHDTLWMSLDVPEAAFREPRHVLGLIMRGYMSWLEAPEA